MPQDRSLRVSDTIAPQKNRYYLRVSRRWRLVGWGFAVLLGLYLVVALSVYGKYITYDNLTYLARDFDLSVRAAYSRADPGQLPHRQDRVRHCGNLKIAGGEH